MQASMLSIGRYSLSKVLPQIEKVKEIFKFQGEGATTDGALGGLKSVPTGAQLPY
jgi:hypothetical protein